jgi:hypothetical protein
MGAPALRGIDATGVLAFFKKVCLTGFGWPTGYSRRTLIQIHHRYCRNSRSANTGANIPVANVSGMK